MPINSNGTIRLTEDEINQYKRDGYVIVENLVTEEELEAMRIRVREYTHGGRIHEKIKFQVEPRIARGELKVEHPGDGIRKVGKLVHYDAVYRGLGAHRNIVGILEQILGQDIMMFRGDMLLKPPEVGSAKGMHQDSPYWPIEPMDLCSCWFALDDATIENGCMQVVPGDHKIGALAHVNVTDDFVIDEEKYAGVSRAIHAPVKAGGGLFFHSLLPHGTAPNQSDHWRRAIALSYMSSQSKVVPEKRADIPYLIISGKSYPGCVPGDPMPLD